MRRFAEHLCCVLGSYRRRCDDQDTATPVDSPCLGTSPRKGASVSVKESLRFRGARGGDCGLFQRERQIVTELEQFVGEFVGYT